MKTDEEHACVLAAAARALEEPLSRALEDDGSMRTYAEIDLPLVPVLTAMERTGAAIDVAHLDEIGERTQGDVDALRARIIELAGEEFNVDSPKQLGHILFEVLGLPPKKKTQRGYSTDAKVLKENRRGSRAACARPALPRNSPRSSRPTSMRCPACAQPTGASIPRSTRR